MLSPSLNSSTSPTIVLSSCSSELGCDSATAISCSCVAICSEGTLRWVVLLRGRLRALTKVGACGSSITWDDAMVAKLRAEVSTVSTSEGSTPSTSTAAMSTDPGTQRTQVSSTDPTTHIFLGMSRRMQMLHMWYLMWLCWVW